MSHSVPFESTSESAESKRPALITWFILPVLVLLVPAATWQLLGKDIPRPAASGAPILFTLPSLLVLERLFPMHRSWNKRPDGLDLFLLVANRAVDIAVLAGTVGFVAQFGEALKLGTLWPTSWPVALQVMAGIVIAESVRYGIHRFSHRPGFWWRVHRTHHEPERMYSLNGPRLHPVNFLWVTAANTVPLLLLGAELETVILVINTTVVFVIFQHANVNFRFDGIRHVFATPDMHRLHHAKNAPSGGVNFSVVLLIIDRLFGTFAHREDIAAHGIGLADNSPQWTRTVHSGLTTRTRQ